MFCHFLTFFFNFFLFKNFLFFSIPFQVMPKCADVQLQLGSDNLLQDIKDVVFFRKLQRLGSYTFGKALNNAMKQGRLPEIDAWICPSAVLARPLEAHERRHRHPEFDVWIVVDIVAKTWRREILAGTKFWLLVLCLDQYSVGRSWTFHAKLQMRLLLFTVWDLYHRMWKDNRAGVLAAKGQRFLLFAYNACNACFGPWNTHANFDTKKAWFCAWMSSSCASSQWFLDNLQELAHDRGILVPLARQV